MPNDIKRLLDEIIDDTDHQKNTGDNVPVVHQPVTHSMNRATFDADTFREKLSLCVLKDIICAMMHDETKDLTGMIDDSIIKHIHDDYNGTCFGYLCKARDRLQSPILGDVVQEIEDKTADVETDINDSGVVDDTNANPEIVTKDLLKNVSNYDELRRKLKEEVSRKVVNDVTKVITKSNDAPVFDNIDTSLKKVDNTNNEENPVEAGNTPPTEQPVATESVILTMCSSIVTEQAILGNHISTDEGINRAIITYCIGEMDALFKQDRSRTIVRKYLK
jgi:hypothetical protein